METLEVQEQTFDFFDTKIAAKVWGSPGLPQILALHGWLDNGASFEPLAREICHKYQLIAVDLWGHGQSGHRPAGFAYPVLDYVPLVESIRRQLQIEQLTLMGHSMGSGIAALYAGTFPSQCARLIMIEGLGPLSTSEEASPERLFSFCTQLLKQSEKRAPLYPSYIEAAAVRERATGLSRQASQLLAQRGTRAVQGGFTWSTDPRLKYDSQYRLTETQVCAFLSAITCSVSVISAREGLKFAVGDALERRLQSIKNLEVSEVDGGHHVHMDNPATVAKLVLEFLVK